MPVKVTQPEAPVAPEVIATSIQQIADAMEQINKTRLTRKAIVALIRDQSGLPKKNHQHRPEQSRRPRQGLAETGMTDSEGQPLIPGSEELPDFNEQAVIDTIRELRKSAEILDRMQAREQNPELRRDLAVLTHNAISEVQLLAASVRIANTRFFVITKTELQPPNT